MWWLLTTVCLIQMVGNAFSLLGKKPVNPEANMNTSQMISYWGYPHEMHEVITADGYILPLYRIPHGKNDANHLAWALFWHMLVMMFGWETAEEIHLYLETDCKEFWAFSFDEMVKYDLPATIDFIVKKTGQKQIYYVGYSQGALIAFAAFAINPQLAEKIKINFALGPVATVKYTTSILRLIAYIHPTLFKILFGEKEFLLNTFMNKVIGQNVCNREVLDAICNNLLTLVGGYHPQNLNESRLDVYLTEIPAGTSVQNMLHYAQLINKGTFQAYDWGSPSLNILHHNQPAPSLYHVEDMKVPTAVWSGGQDILVDPIDVKNLESRVYNFIYHKIIPSYNHLDFGLGLDAYDQIYTEIITMMNEAL